MIGIGPFIPHKDTVFAKETGGSLDLTLNLVAMLRLMNPNAMIPATTAVGTIDPRGREKAILSGANVVMPNLSPVSVRKNYMLYDNKLCTGDEAADVGNVLMRESAASAMRSSQTAVITGNFKRQEKNFGKRKKLLPCGA